MNWFKRLFIKDKITPVFFKTSRWEIIDSDGKVIKDEFSYFEIFHNQTTGEYILKESGYKPRANSEYIQCYKIMRMLNEGKLYVESGELFYTDKNNGVVDNKEINNLNETECQIYLAKALKEENYELAEKLRRRLEDLNS